jgi:hypothetical protein
MLCVILRVISLLALVRNWTMQSDQDCQPSTRRRSEVSKPDGPRVITELELRQADHCRHSVFLSRLQIDREA